MSSTLSGIPAAGRRRLAATLGLFAVLFVAVGTVAATGATTGPVEAFVAVALVVAFALALLAWGVLASLREDAGERGLDAAVHEALAAHASSPALACGCGHQHDPDELHVTDDPCAHDGAGVGCTHSCDTCVLARAR